MEWVNGAQRCTSSPSRLLFVVIMGIVIVVSAITAAIIIITIVNGAVGTDPEER